MIKSRGSKRRMLGAILEAVASVRGARTVIDLFSGTSRVGHALKAAGYRVLANDHNGYAQALARCYVEADNFMPKPLEQKVLDGAWAINHALGYDMNSVEFACKDGVPYAIDFTNPAPDMDIHSILPRYFPVVVDEMAKLVIRAVRENWKHETTYAWQRYLEKPVARKSR